MNKIFMIKNLICKLVLACCMLAGTSHSFAQSSWSFGTSVGVATPTGVPANMTVGAITQGNNNGTTTILTNTSASSGYTGASGQFNAGAAARVGALNINANGSAYFEVTLTPDTGYKVSVTGISLGSRSTSTGPQLLSIRSSKDAYATTIASNAISNNSIWVLLPFSPFTTVESSVSTPITLRIYGSGGTGSPSVNTANWRIDDLTITATAVLAATPPTITNFIPTNGGIDTRVTITGTGFTPTSVVTINGTPVRRMWYYSPTQIVVQVGDNTTTGKVNVDGVVSSTDFTVNNCAAPTGVSATSATNGGNAAITINWTNPSTVNRADILYRIAGSTLPATEFTRLNTGTGNLAAGARTFTIQGLNAATNYEVFVQIRCDGTTWSNWVSAGTVQSGAGATCNRPTITSPTNNTTLAGLQANFTWSAVPNATDYQVFTVEVDGATPPFPVGGTAQVNTFTTNSATVNFLKPNTKYRVWIRANCGSTGLGEYNDNFYVTTGAGAVCTAPVFNVANGAVSNGFATRNLTWAALNNLQYIGLSYRKQPSGDWLWASQAANVTAYTITGLSNGVYEIRLFSVCNNGSVLYAPVQTTTVTEATEDCDIPTGLGFASLNAPAGATLNWTATLSPNKIFQIVYWENTTPATKYYYASTSNSFELRNGIHGGIVAGTTYGYYVNVWCNGQFGGSSAVSTFTTGSSTVADRNDLAVTTTSSTADKTDVLVVYPNPAKQSALISYQSAVSSNQPMELTVIDALGREVYRETTQNTILQTTLNVSKLALGVYLVRVQDGGQLLSKKLVVE
jgi:hypothetical protein